MLGEFLQIHFIILVTVVLLTIYLTQVPQQNNGYDCGIFILKYFEFITDLFPIVSQLEVESGFRRIINDRSFHPSDLKDFRAKILNTALM